MNLRTATEEWGDLSDARKLVVLNNLFKQVARLADLESDTIYNMLQEYVEMEDEDYFGTEGLDV